ncbi:signal peptidase I [Nodosilinea sp. LEGE 07088]|uniref:signal peptidase I n=1 Tax=Nodosilinea sp. LEGE 07088 TaxID=2777968 RepID=UPI00187FF5D3|nr:signal peptidase I [Nodosilinea sp. LEGE 07088]MBE9137614.1 signal peptidase I [Nodosilinea sp. LEGE 07088]
MKVRPTVLVGQPWPKSPWLAVNLSAALPGAGQIYDGAIARGIVIAIAFWGLIAFMLWSIFAPTGNTLRGLLGLGPLIGLYLFTLWDSHHVAKRGITLREFSPLRYQSQDPWYPVFLSQVLPGLGHLFLQQAAVGGLLLLLGIAIAYGANFNPRLLPLPPAIWAVGCGLAYRAAPTRRRQWGLLAGLLVAIVVTRCAISAIPFVVPRQVVQCIVPSESMLPTLAVGDRIFVRPQPPDFVPAVGDIIVFSNPERTPIEQAGSLDQLMVKRVIALPGQQVAVRQGRVWIDGTPLADPHLKEPILYQWGPETVPADHLFVLGDNRNRSRDSHIWGFLPRPHVVGNAYKIYWPPQRVQPLTEPSTSIKNKNLRSSQFQNLG